jgi:hypothetical protein
LQCILGHAFPSASARLRADGVYVVGQPGPSAGTTGPRPLELGRARDLRPVDGDAGDAERRRRDGLTHQQAMRTLSDALSLLHASTSSIRAPGSS